MNKIEVSNNNTQLGILSQNGDLITFEYFNNVDRGDYLPGLLNKINISKTLFSVFEALLPERNTLTKLQAIHSINNDIGVLLYLESIHGAFEFNLPGENKVSSNKPIHIDFNENITEILNSNYKFPNILDYDLKINKDILNGAMNPEGTAIGLSGVREKLGITFNEEEKIIRLSPDAEYFMKPYSEALLEFTQFHDDSVYAPYLHINEHLFMTMARDFGFNVPWNGIIQGEKDYHYIIKRFDRFKGGKLNHFDMGVFLNLTSKTKYSPSYEKVYDLLYEKLSEKEFFKAFQFLIFSAVIGHGDLHAKNISIIYSNNYSSEAEFLLAPLYDVSTTRIYKTLGDKDIGLTINSSNKQIRLDSFVTFGKRYGFTEKDITSEVEKIASFFASHFPRLLDALPAKIQTLPFKKNRYTTSPLKEQFMRYYETRKTYINDRIMQIKPDPKKLFS